MADPIDWTSLLGTLGSSAVGAIGSNYVANQAANNATQSAQQAAQMAQFRPVGVTTRFGKSGFNYDPTTGQLIGAGYQVAPDVAGLREGLLGMASTGLGQAQQIQGIQPNINEQARGLFNLGAQYVAQTPQAAAQQYMTQQQQLIVFSNYITILMRKVKKQTFYSVDSNQQICIKMISLEGLCCNI